MEKMNNKALIGFLTQFGFEPIGSGWYEVKGDSIRARIWDGQVDFYYRHLSDGEDELRFRGIVSGAADVGFVLDKCFGFEFTKK